MQHQFKRLTMKAKFKRSALQEIFGYLEKIQLDSVFKKIFFFLNAPPRPTSFLCASLPSIRFPCQPLPWDRIRIAEVGSWNPSITCQTTLESKTQRGGLEADFLWGERNCHIIRLVILSGGMWVWGRGVRGGVAEAWAGRIWHGDMAVFPLK